MKINKKLLNQEVDWHGETATVTEIFKDAVVIYLNSTDEDIEVDIKELLDQDPTISRYVKESKVPTFDEHVNESKVADAIQDQIDYWYDGDDSDKEKAAKAISKLAGYSPKEVKNRLKNVKEEDAMEALMESKSTYESDWLNDYVADGYQVISISNLWDQENDEVIEGLGYTLLWFVDADKELKKFWNKYHSSWNEKVAVLRKKKDMFLATENEVIKLTIKATQA